MRYSVEITQRALRELEELPIPIYNKAVSLIDRLEIEPFLSGSLKLKGFRNRWRIRIGDYRILYERDDNSKSITVFRVVHRKEAYR